MAGIAKWLRPRIVVPICVGSTPTTRPIKSSVTSVAGLFIMQSLGRTHTKRSFVSEVRRILRRL